MQGGTKTNQPQKEKNEKMKAIRKLKVTSQKISKTVEPNQKNRLWQKEYLHKLIPKINIQGDWLDNLGFEIGNYVEIQITKGKIVITQATG